MDQANKSRAQLRQAIADSEAELAAICSAVGERPVHIRQVRNKMTYKMLLFGKSLTCYFFVYPVHVDLELDLHVDLVSQDH